jgi:hypothetical protein
MNLEAGLGSQGDATGFHRVQCELGSVRVTRVQAQGVFHRLRLLRLEDRLGPVRLHEKAVERETH